jgi:beta-xylosidase
MEHLLITGNPVITHIFTSDPTAIVYEDTVYLYTGHDEAPVESHAYVMNDWRCFSSTDLVHWNEHPVPLRAKDFKWAKGDAYASKVIHHNGKFYWFVSVSDAANNKKAIALAACDNPAGPFTDALGRPLINHEMLPATHHEKANLDPTVLIDDNGSAFLFWGNGACYFAKLKPGFDAPDGDIKMINLPGFTEGAHIHKRNGWYYLSYGYGMPEKVAYAMSRSIYGPWEFKGILNEIAGNCETNRPCIIRFKEQDYFIYHNGALPNGGSHRRSVCIDRLYYNEDGTMQRVIMTSEGV